MIWIPLTFLGIIFSVGLGFIFYVAITTDREMRAYYLELRATYPLSKEDYKLRKKLDRDGYLITPRKGQHKKN